MVQNTMVVDFGAPPQMKRQRVTPPLNERVMLYVRQDNEDVYTPLHVVPPTLGGLLNAVSSSSCSSCSRPFDAESIEPIAKVYTC